MSRNGVEKGETHPPREGHSAPVEPGAMSAMNSAMQARMQELAGKIAALEKELVDLTSGQLDSIVTYAGDTPFLFAAARQALFESEQRFRAIFDSALDAMFLCDDARRYVDANSAACRFVGKPKEHILGSAMGEFLEFSDLEARWTDMLFTGKQTGTYELRRSDGTRVALEYSAVANIVPGCHLVVLRDVTVQQRAIRMRDELYVELERRNRGLLALNEIGVKLGESLNIHAVYETIFREFTNNFLESPHLAVALYDKERQLFLCDFAVVDGEVYDPSVFPPMPLGEGPTSRAFLDLEPKIVDIEKLATTLSSERILHIGDEASPRSGLYVPLIINNEAIGVLSIQHYEADAFKAVDLTLLSVMAYHAAAAIANALLYSQTQQEIADRKQREYELAAIAALSRDLRHVQSPAAVIDILLAQAETSFSALGSAVVLNLESRVVGEVAGRGEYAPLHGTRLNVDANMLRARSLHERRVIQASPWRGTSGAIRSVVGVPLSVQNSQIGTIWLGLGRLTHVDDVGFLASLADIAASTLQRTRLYDQVQLQAQRLTRVMDTVMFGLLLLDKDHRIVIANQPARQDLEILAGVGVGDPLRELGGVALSTILETAHGGVYGCELVIESQQFRVYDVLANPVEIEGETDGWVLVIRDITRDRELQDQLQRQDRLAAVGQLAAGIAHDFNNILAVIVLYVQMLQRSANLGAAEQKRLGVVREQAQHASALVRQVLDFSRMSVIERGPVDLVELVRSTFDMWQRILPENIRLTFTVEGTSGMYTLTDTDADTSADTGAESDAGEDTGADTLASAAGNFVVDGDATRLQQILMNLAVNARDAMPDGGELFIRLAPYTPGVDDAAELQNLPPGRWIALTVEDTGMGIALEHLPHVFDPFFTTKAVGKGTGLGLAQVYGIVRQHGGHVTVDSRVGAGTHFHILLPLLPDAAGEAEPFGDEGVASAGTGRVLLVEDNAAAREATRAILELYGYDVLEAVNGTDALRVFRAQNDPVDLVLTDVMMPEMGGLELFQTLVEVHPDVRVLFMTGYPLDAAGRQFMELGTVDWLQKPFSIQQLTEKIQNLLQ